MCIYKIVFGYIPKRLPQTFISVASNCQNPALLSTDTELEADLTTEGFTDKDIKDTEGWCVCYISSVICNFSDYLILDYGVIKF